MGRLRVVIVIVIGITAAMLLIAPLSSAASNTVKVYYQDVQNIHVEFPNGKEISKGGVLIIITSSDVYDMDRSGITFYKVDEKGTVLDKTDTVTLSHTSTVNGNSVTHYFIGLTVDAEMDFSDLVPLDPDKVVPTIPEEIKKIFSDGDLLTTIVLIASLAIGAVMLAIMALVIRMLDSYRYDTEMAE